MNNIIILKSAAWTGKIILTERGYFEGIAYNEKVDIPRDLISGFYNMGIGEIKFKLAVSGHSYTVYDEQLHEQGFIPVVNMWDTSKHFTGICMGNGNQSNPAFLELSKYEIYDREVDKDMDDLKLMINNTKIEIYDNESKKHILK